MRLAIIMLACLLCAAPPAKAMICTVDFAFSVTQGAGTIRPAERLSGTARFTTTGRSFAAEGGARVHMARGEMRIGHDIRGEIWAVITTAGNPVADLLGIHARNVTGMNFAGLAYRGPMTLNLYGRPGTLPAPEIPTDPAIWSAMDLRRSFALHAYGYDRLAGEIAALDVACDPAGMIDSQPESAYPAAQ
ncbi:hypothetical protein [Roseicyclus sp.]|uniref:hypothetical protein n=1 Tax=Roseicyclus sp. TaxID=1914329 RepID=UPI003F6B2FFE